MFQCTACYFPITFSAPPNDPHGITRGMLVGALRGVFACTVDMAPFVMPALLEKLASSTHAAKLDALQTFVACVAPRALTTAQRVNLATPVAVDSRARRNALGGAYNVAALVPFLADLRDTLRGEILGTFDASLFFARTRDLLAGVDERPERGGVGTGERREGDDEDQSEVTEWAFRALRCTAALISREAVHGGAVARGAGTRGAGETMAFRGFVVHLVQACIDDVLAAPDTLNGRAGACILHELSCASCFAYKYVLGATVKPLLELLASFECTSGAATANVPLHAAVIETLAMLVGACNDQIDYPSGGHPLEPYAAGLLDSFLRCISHGGGSAADEIMGGREKLTVLPTVLLASMSQHGATRANGDTQFVPDKRSRCAGVRGLCALLRRPPSFIVGQEAIERVLARVTLLAVRDSEAQVRACALRGLRVTSGRRSDLSSLVANAILPAFMSVLDRCIAAEAASCGVQTAAASNAGTVLGALVMLAPLPSFWHLAATQLLQRAVVEGDDPSSRCAGPRRQRAAFRRDAPFVTLAILKTLSAMLQCITGSPAFGPADPESAAMQCSLATTLVRALVDDAHGPVEEHGRIDGAAAGVDGWRGADCTCASRDTLSHTFVCKCAVPCLQMLQTVTMHASPATQRIIVRAVTPLFRRKMGIACCRKNVNFAVGAVVIGAIHPEVLCAKETFSVGDGDRNADGRGNGIERDMLRTVLRELVWVSLYSGPARQIAPVSTQGRDGNTHMSAVKTLFDGTVANAAAACFASLVNKLPGSDIFDAVLSNLSFPGAPPTLLEGGIRDEAFTSASTLLSVVRCHSIPLAVREAAMRVLVLVAHAIVVRGGEGGDGTARKLLAFVEAAVSTLSSQGVPVPGHITAAMFAQLRLGAAAALGFANIAGGMAIGTQRRGMTARASHLGNRVCLTRQSNALVSPVYQQRFVWENFSALVEGGLSSRITPAARRFHMFAALAMLQRLVVANSVEGWAIQKKTREEFVVLSMGLIVQAMTIGIKGTSPATGMAGPTNCAAAANANAATDEGRASIDGRHFATHLDVHGRALRVLKNIMLFTAKGGTLDPHVHTLVPTLLMLSQAHPKAIARETALYCLGVVSHVVPYTRLHPYKGTIAPALRRVLDDPRRSVRKEAVRCQNAWSLLKW